MHMDETEYIRAIVVAPDDDAPRLAYADWLDAHGRSERAEFIRVQIELARSPHHPEQALLQARQADLLKSHERSWAPNNSLALFFEWRRGFVTVLHPCARGVFGGEDSLKILTEFPLAEELEFGFCMTDAEFHFMPLLPNLRSFGIGGNVRVTDVSIRRIGNWQTLHKLRMNGDQITDASLSYLVGLAELRELDLSYTAITDSGLSHLAALTSLESLDVSETRITGQGLSELTRLPQLRKLNLSNTLYWNHGLSELVECRSLEELRLGSILQTRAITDADLTVLQGFPALRVLDLGGWCELTDSFVRTLRQRLPLKELWYNGQRQAEPSASADPARKSGRGS